MTKNADVMLNDINTWLGEALAQLQAGRLSEAETVFQRILKLNPRHADANHLLGVIAIQRGQFNQAAQLISRAIQSNPGWSMYYNNLGLALYWEGRLTEALAACERTIQLSPNLPEAYYNYGNVLTGLGRVEKALEAHGEAIRLKPEYADAHFSRGNILLAARRAKEAEDSYRRALQLNPANAVACNNLGVVLVETGKFDEALAVCDRAIQLNPRYAHAYNCRGSALRKLRRLQEALSACENALEIDPEYANAHYNRGNILLDMGCVEKAENSYRRSLALSPHDAHLHSNLLFVLAAGARLPFDRMLEELRQWDSMHGQEGRMSPLSVQEQAVARERRLRIGYVSPHLRSHVVNFFFEPLLASHDRTHFEIYCYASGSNDSADAATQRLRGMAEHWRFVGDKNDVELARLIYDDAVDILVDLAGHTEGNRLKAFTYRPAPVQASYLGFFAATGLAAMDYWISDEVLHPQDSPELAVEEIYRLPRCWVCYQPPDQAPPVSPCPTSDAQVVFGYFNSLSKLTAEVIETWCRLLQSLPGSRLLLMARYLGDLQAQVQIIERFASHGIGQERLLLRGGAAYARYFATFAEVDIVLDPFPRTGGTTTAEALWMGVPVVTLAGQRYVERISASKLTAVGLEDLIAHSREEYIEKALSLAHDPERRAELRKSLRETMAQSPLCDSAGLARAMEFAYRVMWERFLSKPS